MAEMRFGFSTDVTDDQGAGGMLCLCPDRLGGQHEGMNDQTGNLSF